MNSLKAAFLAITLSAPASMAGANANISDKMNENLVRPETPADLCVMRTVNQIGLEKARQGISQLTMNIDEIKRTCEADTKTELVVTQDWQELNITLTPPPARPASSNTPKSSLDI